MPFIVPPGGFAGYNQMTPASRAALGRVGGVAYKSGTRRKRNGAKKTRRAARSKSARKSRMKFGSPAWQRKYKVGKFRKK